MRETRSATRPSAPMHAAPATAPRRRRAASGLVLILVFAASGWIYTQHVKWLAAYWQQRLQTAPAAEIPGIVHCLAGLRSRGLAALVDGLASPRSEVREAALAQLQRTLSAWSVSPPSAADCLSLAEHLAVASAGFEGWPAQQAAGLAEQLLRLQLPDDVDRLRLASHCQQVFHQCRWKPRRDRTPVAALPAPAPTDGADISLATGEATSPELTLNQAQKLNPPTPAKDRETANAENSAPAPRASEPNAWDLAPPEASVGTKESATPEPLSVTAAMASGSGPRLATLDTAALLSLLREDDPTAIHAAEQELQARGFQPQHLELARRLADRDPVVRRRWVEQIPKLTSIDPRPWLWWLATDADADVRWTALSTLATTGDHTTRRQLIETARIDSDPRIRAIADRLTATGNRSSKQR